MPAARTPSHERPGATDSPVAGQPAQAAGASGGGEPAPRDQLDQLGRACPAGRWPRHRPTVPAPRPCRRGRPARAGTSRPAPARPLPCHPGAQPGPGRPRRRRTAPARSRTRSAPGRRAGPPAGRAACSHCSRAAGSLDPAAASTTRSLRARTSLAQPAQQRVGEQRVGAEDGLLHRARHRRERRRDVVLRVVAVGQQQRHHRHPAAVAGAVRRSGSRVGHRRAREAQPAHRDRLAGTGRGHGVAQRQHRTAVGRVRAAVRGEDERADRSRVHPALGLGEARPSGRPAGPRPERPPACTARSRCSRSPARATGCSAGRAWRRRCRPAPATTWRSG